MTELNLSKIERTILGEAAARGGSLILPDGMKPVTTQRLLGKLRKHELIEGGEGFEPSLTPAGYQAIGLRAPRLAIQNGSGEKSEPQPRKADLVLELIKRPDGASLPELVAATGWLGHTTRAAICRLRKSGQDIIRSSRTDGTGTYRLVPPEPILARPSRRRSGKAAAA